MTTDDALIVDKFNLSRLIRSKVAFQYGESILMAGQEINNGLSLVLFDNAIELMSSAAFEHLSHPIKKNRNFNPDFTNIKPKLGSLLETNVKIDISSLLQLHDVRNAAQHNGICPSNVDMERFKQLTEKTLYDISWSAFRIKFELISQAALIKDSSVKELYSSAEKYYFEGKFSECIISCGAAFQIAKMWEVMKLYGNMRAPHEISLYLSKFKADDYSLGLTKVVEKLGEELEILELGLDYKKYQIFREIFSYSLEDWTPNSDFTEGKIFYEPTETYLSLSRKVGELMTKRPPKQLKDEARFCLLFVIEPILTWESIPRSNLIEQLEKTIVSFLSFFKSVGKDIQ